MNNLSIYETKSKCGGGGGGGGAVDLAEALKVNKSVAILHLACNSIGDLGVAALDKTLEMNKTVCFGYTTCTCFYLDKAFEE